MGKKKKTVNHFLPTYRGGHSPEIQPRTTYCLRKPWESRTDGLVGRRGAQQAGSAQLCPHSRPSQEGFAVTRTLDVLAARALTCSLPPHPLDGSGTPAPSEWLQQMPLPAFATSESRLSSLHAWRADWNLQHRPAGRLSAFMWTFHTPWGSRSTVTLM